MTRLKIISLNDGSPTSFDGEYLLQYDPTRDGTDRDGNLMNCHLVTTPDPEKARQFASGIEALELWRLAHGIRPDGRPNRPLTAFTVEVC